MKTTIAVCVFVASMLVLGGTPARAAEMPEPIMKMLTEATRTGDTAVVELTASLAKKAYPGSALEIDRAVAHLIHPADSSPSPEGRIANLLHGWGGEAELGASRTAGNTDDSSLAFAANVRREGVDWRDHFNATVDYKRSAQTKITERFTVSNEVQYKFNTRLFALALLGWEHDRSAGFDRRYSESLGLGYSVYRSPRLSLDVTLGPAFRQTDRTGIATTGPLFENETQARISTTASWLISPTITLSEEASFYVGGGDNTYQSTTAFTSKVYGQLSARASFFLKKETAPPPGLLGTDTISRLTLVYGF